VLALLEQDDRAPQEAPVNDGEGALVEIRRHVDDDDVGVADGAVELLAVPVEHADPAGGLDEGAQGPGEHVVAGDQDHPEGRALGVGNRRVGRGALRRNRDALGAARAGLVGGRVGTGPGEALDPAAGTHRPASPRPWLSATLTANTARLSR
jgi:hypothetical protein